MARAYRILSIDGGGIRGVIPAFLLTELERRMGARIAELFDLIVGTSTGGILAVGLTAPSNNGKPRHSAEDLLDLYAERGKEIFERSFWKGITSVAGVADELYDADNLEAVLKQYVGNTQLRNSVRPIVVTSYDIERRQPYFFKTRHARTDGSRNHYLRAVARATSAAPTYFEVAETRSVDSNTVRYLIDGGVFANNPALCAFAEALSQGIDAKDIVVLSLGTGVATRRIPYDDAKDWGVAGWVRPVISVMMDGVSDAVDYQLAQLLPPAVLRDADENTTAGDADPRYFRFDIRLEHALDDLDAANAANIEALKGEAARILEDPVQGAAFGRLCDVLQAD